MVERAVLLRRVGRLCSVALALALAASVSNALRAGHASAAAPRALTIAQVRAAVAAGMRLKKLPDGVRPPLREVPDDNENVFFQDCPAAEKVEDATFGQCTYGHGARLVVLFGDSHAGMWFDGVRAAAVAAGWRMRIYYRTGCPVPSLTFWSREHKTPATDCDRWRTKAIETIRAVRPALVVLTSATYQQPLTRDRTATAAQWRNGLTATLRALAAPKRRLLVLGDIPVEREPMPDCLARHERSIDRCMSKLGDALVDVLQGAERAASHAAHAEYVDTTSWLCARACPTVVHGIVVYRNSFHITATYSYFLRGALREALRLKG